MLAWRGRNLLAPTDGARACRVCGCGKRGTWVSWLILLLQEENAGFAKLTRAPTQVDYVFKSALRQRACTRHAAGRPGTQPVVNASRQKQTAQPHASILSRAHTAPPLHPLPLPRPPRRLHNRRPALSSLLSHALCPALTPQLCSWRRALPLDPRPRPLPPQTPRPPRRRSRRRCSIQGPRQALLHPPPLPPDGTGTRNSRSSPQSARRTSGGRPG